MTFVIFALPRSRTCWLSRFLSVGGWHCGHDEMKHFRTMDDVQSWLSQPMTGSAETGIAPFWRLLKAYAPDARVVTVRRDPREVLESLVKLGCQRAAMQKMLAEHSRKLDQIEARWPDALRLEFGDLQLADPMRRLSRHCLGLDLDVEFWRAMSPINMQAPWAAQARYAQAYRSQIEKLAKLARQASIAQLARRPVIALDGLEIRRDTFDALYHDAKDLMSEHVALAGEDPDSYLWKNTALTRQLDYDGRLHVLTARANGRVFGYIMTMLTPSLEKPGRVSAVHTTICASRDAPGLGMTLQRAAIEQLRADGVDEVFYRVGVRADGPKMAAGYRRLGAEFAGEWYRLDLKAG